LRDTLAEQLLTQVMDWDTPTAKREFAKIRYLAGVKYDGYQNFEPGRRFVESLGMWLRQFKTVDERRVAYQFVMTRMVYVSGTQMDHLVDLFYPQRVLPLLLDQSRVKDGVSPYQVRKIRTSTTFSVLQRKTLFLGMSDGARIDAFRRKNALNNEQVSVSYELSPEKATRMAEKLREWLADKKIEAEPTFENIFLIDDFSGSGRSILRFENGIFKGKLARFVEETLKNNLGKICVAGGAHLFVATYLGTGGAKRHLTEALDALCKTIPNSCLADCVVLDPLQVFEDKLSVPQADNPSDLAFDGLLGTYYDDRLEDENTKTGGTDVKHGYAGCGLPLVLCHNCPNNSVYLLWGQTERLPDRDGLQALFPRISRHLESR
jgi:hypothetical protein